MTASQAKINKTTEYQENSPNSSAFACHLRPKMYD
jgi:hypothetical protein